MVLLVEIQQTHWESLSHFFLLQVLWKFLELLLVADLLLPLPLHLAIDPVFKYSEATDFKVKHHIPL